VFVVLPKYLYMLPGYTVSLLNPAWSAMRTRGSFLGGKTAGA
jgi:hypothetical protein